MEAGDKEETAARREKCPVPDTVAGSCRRSFAWSSLWIREDGGHVRYVTEWWRLEADCTAFKTENVVDEDNMENYSEEFQY